MSFWQDVVYLFIYALMIFILPATLGIVKAIMMIDLGFNPYLVVLITILALFFWFIIWLKITVEYLDLIGKK
jgi:hypothetical protein